MSSHSSAAPQARHPLPTEPSRHHTRVQVSTPVHYVPHASDAGLAGVPQQLLADISASHRQLTGAAHQNIPPDDTPLHTIDSDLVPPISGRLPAESASQRAVLANLAVQQVNSGILSIHPALPIITSIASATGQSAGSDDEDMLRRTRSHPAVESAADLHSL
jgi:hypothetical protein